MVLFGHEDMAEFFSVRDGKLSILKMRLFSDKDSKARRPGFAYTHRSPRCGAFCEVSGEQPGIDTLLS
jgi:hypothetical protein